MQIPARNRLVFHRLDKKLTTIIHQTRGFASHERLTAGSGQFSQLGSIHNVMNLLSLDNDQKISTELAVGASISLDKWQAFAEAVNKLSTTIGMPLPIYGSALTGVLNLQTSLDLRQITEKQKSLKILNAYATLINELGGKLCASGGEGQLKGIITSKQISPELSRLYTKIKAIFDPYGILAPKIKRPIELRDIAGKISPNYDRF